MTQPNNSGASYSRQAKAFTSFRHGCTSIELSRSVLPPNKSLQRTFDPSPIFAAAKTSVASNAAEFKR